MKLLLACVVFVSLSIVAGRAEVPNQYDTTTRDDNLSLNEYAEIECEEGEDDDCHYYLAGSKCENHKCTCPKSWLLNKDRTKCLVPAREFGSSCEEDVQCSETLLAGGVCLENSCKCKEGYHYLRGTCWKTQKLHQKCFRREQCFSNYDYRGQQCENKECTCSDGYYDRFNVGCRKVRNPGESCNVDSDCPNGHTCDKMKCSVDRKSFNSIQNEFPDFLTDEKTQRATADETDLVCSRGEFQLNGKCVLELGMPCKANDECSHIAKAGCFDGVCSCDSVLAIANENNRKCLQVARGKIPDLAKSTCKENPQCAVFGENSHCVNKKCACKNGTYWESENQFCWGVNKLGENCLSDKDCHPAETHAVCAKNKDSDRVCTCADGYRMKNERCLPEAREIGGYCEGDEECLFANSKCEASTNECVCRDRYYPDNGKCVAGVGSPCDNGDHHCDQVRNANCERQNTSEKYCVCNAGHVVADDSKYCLPAGEYGDACLKTFQCKFKMGPLSECRNETCLCEETAHHNSGRCYRNKGIGDTCSIKQECFTGDDENSTMCLNGYCACQYEYALVNGDCVNRNTGNELKINIVLTAFTTFYVTVKAMT